MGHVVENLELTVEHEEGVVHIGHTCHQIGLHHHLVVFYPQELHLCGALLREEVAEEVNGPTGSHGQLVGLRGGIAVPRRDGTRRREGELRQECQPCHLELVFCHLHVEGGVQQVGVVVEGLLDEDLQLGVGEHAAPRQIAEGDGVGLRHQGIGERHVVADDSLGVHLRALIFLVESATGHKGGSHGHKQYLGYLHISYSSTL